MLINISFYWIPLLLSLVLTARTVLILFGRIKEPILYIWEHYGEEILYYPIIHLLMWGLTVILCIVLLVQDLLQVAYTPFFAFIVVLCLLWLWVTVNRHLIYRYKTLLDRIPAFPLWYRDLGERTTRYERRRIAYLWLRLPRHMKLIFNNDDRSFIDWTDQVIISIITNVNDPLTEDYLKWGL